MLVCKGTFTHFDNPLGEKLDSNGTCLKLPEKLTQIHSLTCYIYIHIVCNNQVHNFCKEETSYVSRKSKLLFLKH